MARHIPAYGIFIIESMDSISEENGKLSGWALKTILDLSDIDCHYMYIRTYDEFKYAMELFSKSDFGFLHISCHGSKTALQLTLDEIPFEELAEIMGPHMKYRRLFLSSCDAACFALAEHFIPQYHCYSIIGPAETIDYDKAAIFWSSYYYLMYQRDQVRMWQKRIMPMLENITRTFCERLNYFSIIHERYLKAPTHLRHLQYHNGSKVLDVVPLTRFRNRYWQEAISETDASMPGMDEVATLDS